MRSRCEWREIGGSIAVKARGMPAIYGAGPARSFRWEIGSVGSAAPLDQMHRTEGCVSAAVGVRWRASPPRRSAWDRRPR
jgi:hypothetical protein